MTFSAIQLNVQVFTLDREIHTIAVSTDLVLCDFQTISSSEDPSLSESVLLRLLTNDATPAHHGARVARSALRQVAPNAHLFRPSSSVGNAPPNSAISATNDPYDDEDYYFEYMYQHPDGSSSAIPASDVQKRREEIEIAERLLEMKGAVSLSVSLKQPVSSKGVPSEGHGAPFSNWGPGGG